MTDEEYNIIAAYILGGRAFFAPEKNAALQATRRHLRVIIAWRQTKLKHTCALPAVLGLCLKIKYHPHGGWYFILFGLFDFAGGRGEEDYHREDFETSDEHIEGKDYL